MERTKLTPDQIAADLRAIPEWDLTPDTRIQRRFKFDKYSDALKFVNSVAELAEREDHHPDIDFRWGAVAVAFSTHSAGGVTKTDLHLAKLVDALRP